MTFHLEINFGSSFKSFLNGGANSGAHGAQSNLRRMQEMATKMQLQIDSPLYT